MGFKDILLWPERHVGIAWWVAIVVASPVWLKWTWQILKRLPIWGSKYQRYQLDTQIRTLETLHNDTNRLILYLVRDGLAVALDFCWLCCALAILAKFSKQPLTLSTVVFFATVTLGSSMVGRVIRLRTIVNSLMYYDDSMTKLKLKREKPGILRQIVPTEKP